MQSEKMFELADQLRELRETKQFAEQELKEINAEIERVDYALSEIMAQTETQNFTRAGTMFCLTTTTSDNLFGTYILRCSPVIQPLVWNTPRPSPWWEPSAQKSPRQPIRRSSGQMTAFSI